MWKDSIVIDPTIVEADMMINYAKPKMPDLFDKHDGKPLEEDKSKWNKDYMDTEIVNVVYNFSKERTEHLKEVVRYLYPN